MGGVNAFTVDADRDRLAEVFRLGWNHQAIDSVGNMNRWDAASVRLMCSLGYRWVA